MSAICAEYRRLYNGLGDVETQEAVGGLFAGREIMARQERRLAGVWSYGLGTACMRRGDFTTALEEYDLALELDPDMVNTICSKAELLERTRDYDAAADLVSRALALEPDNAYAGCIAGKLFQQKGELTEAINVLEKARERSTADKITSECCLLLGQLYARTGEYKKSYDLVSEGNRLTASGFEDIDGIRNKLLGKTRRIRNCGSCKKKNT